MLSPIGWLNAAAAVSAREIRRHTAGNYFLRIPAVILGNGCLALAGQRYRDAGADRNR